MKKTRLKYTQERDGRWYFVRRTQVDGKSKVKWTPIPGDPSENEAAMKAYHRLKEGLPATPRKSRYTIDVLIDSYRDSTRWPTNRSTQSEYVRTLKRISDKNGSQDARTFKRPNLIAIRDKVAKESPRQADRVMVMFSILFEHSMDLGWRDSNPAKGIKRVNKPKEIERWPVWAQRGFEKNAPPGTTIRTLYELLLGTAQRLTDACQMRWQDIEDDGINVRQGKTDIPLWVPMTERLADYLDTLPRGLTTIIADENGKSIDRHRAQKLLEAVRPLYDGEAFSWHGLRYNAAEEIGDKTDEQVGAITGHKTRKMVQKYTGRTRQQRLARSARRRED